jgi:GDPmannose 4,6-dehydratase
VGLEWREYVRIDESLRRGRAELHGLVGDATRARGELGWEPQVGFEELVRMLVTAQVERLSVEPAAFTSP